MTADVWTCNNCRGNWPTLHKCYLQPIKITLTCKKVKNVNTCQLYWGEEHAQTTSKKKNPYDRILNDEMRKYSPVAFGVKGPGRRKGPAMESISPVSPRDDLPATHYRGLLSRSSLQTGNLKHNSLRFSPPIRRDSGLPTHLSVNAEILAVMQTRVKAYEKKLHFNISGAKPEISARRRP